MTKVDYFKKYYNFAVKSGKKSGINPLVILTQSYLESGGAKSILASTYNNFFGIKADKAWKGKKIKMNTREVVNGKSIYLAQNFRWYDTAEQCFDDHAKFLMTNPRYAKSGLFNPTSTPAQQIDSLVKAGYATDPNYGKVLNAVLANFNSVMRQLTKINKMPIITDGGIAMSLLIPAALFIGYLIANN